MNLPEIPRLYWLLAALVLALVLAGLHIFATVNHLYWRFVWSDTVVHFAGGALAGVLVVAFTRRFRWLLYVVAVVVITIGWETFEELVGVPHASNFVFDTAVDVLMDALGAIVVYLIARKTIWRSAPLATTV